MMTLLIGVLTVLMVLDCLLLILLVLVQLPKKEAGAGMAFGGAATDALFGAGSGNALTKITKWVATGFFVLALTLTILKGRQAKSGSAVEEALRKQAATKATPPAAAAPATRSAEAPTLLTNQIVATNLPADTNK
jgi:preprotein translocase subunit SecG